jgi:hypothetical protein
MRRISITLLLAWAGAACTPAARLYPSGTEYMIDVRRTKELALWRRQPKSPPHLDIVIPSGPQGDSSLPEIVPLYDAVWVYPDTSLLMIRRIRALDGTPKNTLDDYARRLGVSDPIDKDDPGAYRLAHPYIVRDFRTPDSKTEPEGLDASPEVRVGVPPTDAPNAEAERFLIRRDDRARDRITLVGIRPQKHPFMLVLFTLVEREGADHHADLYDVLDHFALAPAQ